MTPTTLIRRGAVFGWFLWVSALALGCDDASSATEASAVGADSVDATATPDAGARDADIVVDSGADSARDAEPEPDAAPLVFERFAQAEATPADVRLCPAEADPEGAPDKVFIECATDGARYAAAAAPAESIVVAAYNVERGFRVDGQLAFLRELAPDVVLVSEADRGCARTDGRHVTDELARALAMDFVYATEFVELNDPSNCEHGNAVLSRYPIGNVEVLRHATNDSWYGRGENRLGGRVAVGADLDLGGRYLRVWSVHFESSLTDEVRSAQAAEVADLGLAGAAPVVIGGDLNSGFYVSDLRRGVGPERMVDQTMRALLERGYVDAHAELDVEARITHPDPVPFVLDVIAGRGVEFIEPDLCTTEVCDGLSDHRPIWVTVRAP